MKYPKTLFTLFAVLLLSASSDAASFDMEGFGNDLSGWTKKKNSAAEYKSAESLYRTYKPTLAPAADGTLLIATTIDHLRGWEGDDRCQLKLTFGKNGEIVTSCVDLTMGSYSFNTGIVTASAALAGASPGTTALTALGTEMSKKLQDKIGKWNEKGGRANFPAVVRQNIELIAKHVKP